MMPTGAAGTSASQAIDFADANPHHRLCLSDALPAASMRDVSLAEPSVASLLPDAGLPADLLRPLPSLTDVRNRTPAADEELRCMSNHLVNKALLRPIEPGVPIADRIACEALATV
jgi:hypothetical protein